MIVLVVFFAVGALALVARLAWWQILQAGQLSEMAHRQTHAQTEVANLRGAIYDRSGTVVLATTIDQSRVIAAADRLTPRERSTVASTLAGILDLGTEGEIRILEELQTGRPYVVLVGAIDPGEADLLREAVLDGRLPGISLEPEPTRVYPQVGGGPGTSLASHLIGFVNRDGVGQYGVEQYYQEQLAGSSTVVEVEKDSAGRPIVDTERVVHAGVPGADLRLTIDAGLQLAVEQELLAAWIADGAASVSAVVMDPYSGEVYAEATYPSYDANDYRAIATTDPGRFVDPVVSSVYEPGSVFKMLTAIAGFETGVVTPSTKLVDTGSLKLDRGRVTIDDADHKAMGPMRFDDAIALSRNVIAAKVALNLGSTVRESSTILHDVWLRFGFGSPTGIDIAGEVGGLVRDPTVSTWREIDLANGSFGQGVAVTPIQLASAYATMMNGGSRVTPHVVAAIGDSIIEPAPGAEVIDAGTSATLVSLMNHVVETVPWYSSRTLIPGYTVGGKTGTAQIWDSDHGRWKSGVFNFSFVGYVARQAGRPDLVIAIEIHQGRPNVRKRGQLEMPVMSFELFRRIATDAMSTSGLLRDLPPLAISVAER